MIMFKKSYLNEALKDLNFRKMTEIQEKIIPKAIKGKDVIGASETGSGKTHAFLLPIFENLDETKEEVQTVILSPTRDLAVQIEKMAKHLASFSDTPIDIRLYSGGTDRNREIARLQKSQPQIVIGTPGKIYDFAIKENLLKIYKAQTLIIDETDMALDIGFIKEIEAITSVAGENTQLMVFSATIPRHLQSFIKKSMNNPVEVILDHRRLEKLDISHHFLKTAREKRLETLDKLLDAINPYLAIIFANKKDEVKEIAAHLKSKNLKVSPLHGDLSARERKQVLRDIEKLEVQYIVASDMASRGIDIEGVSHIINYSFPSDMSFYIHRTGRTGRMGRSGKAYTLYTDKSHYAFKELLKENIALHFIDIKSGRIVEKNKDEKILKQAKNIDEKKRPVKLRPAQKVKQVKPGYKKKHHQQQRRGR